MFKLDADYLSSHYDDFMCSYGDVDVSSIISTPDFTPETFFVKQKQYGEELLFFRDISFHDWVFNMIIDIVKNIDTNNDKTEINNLIYQNILFLLDYRDSASEIANQEFVDMIRRVAAFTVTGDVCMKLHTAEKFNSLAAKFLPIVIQRFRKAQISTRQLLEYSIASGLSGLDLKGAPAAASAYSNEGIKMQGYEWLNAELAAEQYITSLKGLLSKTKTTLFDWTKFIDLLTQKKKLVWMTDDYIESHFDLLVIERLLEEYDDIEIEIIPKNGFHGNDLSYDDLSILINGNLFEGLHSFLSQQRLKFSPYGAKMGAANIRRLSSECVSAIRNAGLLYAKGCRIHEMLQGGLSVDLFSSFYIVRKLSEATTGFLADDFEAVFFHLAPREYAFFGVSYSNARIESTSGNMRISCASTIADHNRRTGMTSIEEIVHEFSELKKLETTYVGDKRPLFQELDMLAGKIEQYTAKHYEQVHNKYENLYRPEMKQIDSELWAKLLNEAKVSLGKDPEELTLLDVGTGAGRDIEYGIALGIKLLGIDNSNGFISILKEKAVKKKIPADSFVFSNMCSLSIGNKLFDIVRMNASLLHLPIINIGFTADLAISEACRVMRDEGLLFVSVKFGSGIALIDTQEGLGKRFYQFYNHELLTEILVRNNFTDVSCFDYFENRGGDTIHWLVHIARKTSYLEQI
jgi:ubiquinone/menaquinone biosynthesis C-methylase UbiE/uncharacterized protein with ATP-grasp and redox domains